MDIQELIDRLVVQQPIEYKELPAIPLYMDQVTTLLESRMYNTGEEAEGKSPTKTMINNYTKAGGLPPSDKKKYSREHLLLLILMWKMKPVLNMKDIGTFTTHLQDNVGTSKDLKEFYEAFLTMEREMRTSMYAAIEEHYDRICKTLQIESGDERAALMYSLLLADHAGEEKRLAELVLEQLTNK